MSKNVIISVVTKDSVQPAGTDAGTPFSYAITLVDGTAVVSADDVALSHQFDAVAPGDYVATVTRFGISASANFSVPADTVVLPVPDTITVNVG